jgi:hypothetical protein
VAFSAEQKRDVRKYMGVSFGFYDLNHRLESMLDLVGGNAVDQSQIETWLLQLSDIDETLTGSAAATASATYGPLKKVDEVEFYQPTSGGSTTTSTITPQEQGRILIARIARALGVSDYLPNGDYFSSRRPMGFTIPLG